MAIFYPQLDLDELPEPEISGDYAERRALKSLELLDDRWRIFHGFEWREIKAHEGERIGEADVIIFHPDLGLLLVEIKGGGVIAEHGEWFYQSLFDRKLIKMDISPFHQARKSRFHLQDKLAKTILSRDVPVQNIMTHTVWFPDIVWQGDVPSEVPHAGFILDSRTLDNPEKQIRSILKEALPHAHKWSQPEIEILIKALAPEINLLPPLGLLLGTIRDRLFRMTQGQTDALRALRHQKRLLIEGCAGSGKTLLAVQLGREHLQAGKRVLFTCYNKHLAEFVAREFEGQSSIDVLNFHELVKRLCEKNGIVYEVPADDQKRRDFFANDCAELLEKASRLIEDKYDTIIVDEAFDFKDAWWIALTSLGKKDHSWYVFYDRNQNIFTDGSPWLPPFEAEPITLDNNVRNTRPVGEFALKLANIKASHQYGVNEGPEPEIRTYTEPNEIPVLLQSIVSDLIKKRKVPADDIVVLSPYKSDNERLGLKSFLEMNKALFTTNMTGKDHGKVRIGTIQAFKGLEADVIILCGIDGHLPACSPANLYVGATRARSMLYLICNNSEIFNHKGNPY